MQILKPSITPILTGLLAIGLAIAGQNRLEAERIVDALLLYGIAIVLLLATFFRTRLPERAINLVPRSDEIDPAEWSKRWWWQLITGLVYAAGLGLGLWALSAFNQDFDRPAPYAWPSYVLGIGLTLLSAALLDNAPATISKIIRHRLRQQKLSPSPSENDASLEEIQPSFAPLRLVRRFFAYINALMAGIGYVLGFWQLDDKENVFGKTIPDQSVSGQNVSEQNAPQQDELVIPQSYKSSFSPPTLWSQTHTWIFLGILLLGLFLRVYRYTEWPFGTWYDEAAAGMFALRMVEDPNWRPVFPGSINITGHYTYLLTKSVEWFGPTTQAVRWVSVLLGMLAIPAAYLAGRELFGRPVGLICMFLIAVSRWHINFSRIAMFNIATPLFVLLALGYLLLALRRNRHLDFALAGLALGLGLCFYPAFQLFVAAVGLYLLYQIVVVRGFLARYWYGLAVLTVLMVLVASPLALFAYKKSDVYLARTNETSLFTNKAPEERLPALIENSRKHLLMFNYKGDPNGRHNLPGEPMLDPVVAGLAVLGLAFCVTRLWNPRSLLLVLWLILALLGGILSLDFEAPQSLRSIVSLPVAYLLAAVPVYLVWRAWDRSVTPYFPRTFGWLALVLLIPIGWSNYHTYFVRQMTNFATWNAYSTPETITAETLNQLDDQTEAYVISYFHGHPVMGYVARDAKPFKRLETTDHLPMPWPQEGNVLMIMNAESRSLFDEAKRFYPDATFEEVQPPFGGPTVVYKALLQESDIGSIQGLTGFYYPNDDWSGEPTITRKDTMIAFDWGAEPPLTDAYSVEWRGVLRVEHFGQHQLILQAPAEAELYIGEELILEADGEQETAGLILAEGNHSIRLRAVGGPGGMTLAWRPPDRTYEVIPARALYVPPVTSNGLLGDYYANGDWEGQPTLSRIDAHFNLYFHVTPLKRPYTVEWRGKIGIPMSGLYTFGLESIDESILTIDGQEVIANFVRNHYQQGRIELEQGLHDIQLRFADRTDHTHVNFYWTPPGGRQQIVPAEVLFPPQGSYEQIAIPNIGQLLFDPSNPTQVDVSMPTLPGLIEPVAAELEGATGVAVTANGTVYISIPAEQTVRGYSAEGELMTKIDSIWVDDEAQPLQEPFDLATDTQGRLYVLDAGTGILARFDAAGNFDTTLPISSDYLLRARGLDIDQDDRIWIPLTTAGRIAAFDMSGTLLKDFPVWPDEDSQPVDVLALPDGDILVTDGSLYKLIRYDSEGRRQLAWDIPVTNTFRGPHMALAADGSIYLTDPEKARIAKLDPSGERVGQWILGTPPTQPVGIAVDDEGRIWYVDTSQGVLGRVVVDSE
ncbi:MAG: PA14 domain-containing protein [Chloroflexota bacterium]